VERWEKLIFALSILFLAKPEWKLIRNHLQREGRIAKPELTKLVN
jgi:hypothetical protein